MPSGDTIVQTVDFFPPVVDDPEAYGAIAAANSMSDIFAMGGDVLFALNVAAFPDNLPLDILTRIFAGGSAKVAEAGGVIAGGHTVTDPEPKYGLAVTGLVDRDQIWTKAGARPGDRLFLTKPLGTGIVTTALKNDAAATRDIDAAVESMLRLNKNASELARPLPMHACTDITGFGLAGHGYEMASKSEVRIEIAASSLPLLPGALAYGDAGHIPGGLRRNERYFSDHGVTIAESVSPLLRTIVFTPETSGGLLFSCSAPVGDTLLDAFARAGEPIWEIGNVVAGSGLHVRD